MINVTNRLIKGEKYKKDEQIFRIEYQIGYQKFTETSEICRSEMNMR